MFEASKAKIQNKKKKAKESSKTEIPSETTVTAESTQNEETSDDTPTNTKPNEGDGNHFEKTTEIKLEAKISKEEAGSLQNTKTSKAELTDEALIQNAEDKRSHVELKEEAPVQNAEEKKSELELQEEAPAENVEDKKPKVELQEKASGPDEEVASNKAVPASAPKTDSQNPKALSKDKTDTPKHDSNGRAKTKSKKVEKPQQVVPAETAPTADPNRRKSSEGGPSTNEHGVVEATVSIPPDDDPDDQVPIAWEKRISRTTGKPYYLNMYTKESQWERPTSPAQPPPVPMETIICRHILIKHKDSRRPFSWKSPNTKITRTKQEATDLLEKYRKDILRGEVYFADIARAYSDCTSADVGGDLGKFTRGMMLKPFEDVAFKLKARQVSDIIETESGVHLIMRLA